MFFGGVFLLLGWGIFFVGGPILIAIERNESPAWNIGWNLMLLVVGLTLIFH